MAFINLLVHNHFVGVVCFLACMRRCMCVLTIPPLVCVLHYFFLFLLPYSSLFLSFYPSLPPPPPTLLSPLLSFSFPLPFPLSPILSPPFPPSLLPPLSPLLSPPLLPSAVLLLSPTSSSSSSFHPSLPSTYSTLFPSPLSLPPLFPPFPSWCSFCALQLPTTQGDHFYKENENLPLQEQMITAMPDVHCRTLTDDDEFFIVACDGIWSVPQCLE